MPPMGVEYLTLEPRPVERTTEYVGTVKSRRSTNVQPQVEGTITHIAVRSGDRVTAGNLLVEIDSSRQKAAVASLESIRLAREADLEYARQQAERQRLLLAAGAVSKQETEQAEAAFRTAEAQLHSIDELIEEGRVLLHYHQVTAPTSGIVGDVPVRVGDRATTSTILTTIDASESLELYVHVPAQQAAGLRAGLPVRIVDDSGAVLATTSIDFVSSQVDERTQTILAKASIPAGQNLRTEQFVRTIVIWSDDPGLTVPLVAVSRVNGVFFAFVAEEVDGRTVAKQRALTLGPLVGNDYVLLSGLAAGERLIVSGVQKIGDGAPVNPTPLTPTTNTSGTAPPARS